MAEATGLAGLVVLARVAPKTADSHHPDQWFAPISGALPPAYRAAQSKHEELLMQRRFIHKTFAGSIAVVALLVAGLASAKPASGAENFGNHVSRCARDVGFDAAHNPGMHRGAAGWDGSACQS